jgi:hypothetical protein
MLFEMKATGVHAMPPTSYSAMASTVVDPTPLWLMAHASAYRDFHGGTPPAVVVSGTNTSGHVCWLCFRPCILTLMFPPLNTEPTSCGTNAYFNYQGQCACYHPNRPVGDGINCCRENAGIVNDECQCRTGFRWSDATQSCGEFSSLRRVSPL